MQSLQLPTYPFKIKQQNNKKYIWDIIRKKYLLLTPEEWVRQHIVHFLIQERKYPKSLIAVEQGLLVNGLKRRADIVGYNRRGETKLIVECKAPTVNITQQTFEQIAQYNITLQVGCLIVTNGLTHYCCVVDWQKRSYTYLNDIPSFEEVLLY